MSIYLRNKQERKLFKIRSNITYGGIASNNDYYNQYRFLNIISESDYGVTNIDISHLSVAQLFIKELRFSNVNINNISLSRKVHIHNCDFYKVNLLNSIFTIFDSSGAHIGIKRKTLILKGGSFNDLNLIDNFFKNLFIYGTTFEKIKIKKSNFESSTILKIDIKNSQIRNLNFNNVSFKKCKFDGIKFHKIKFVNVIFENCEIYNCSFNLSEFENTKFVSSRIKNIEISNTKIRKEFFQDLKPPIERIIFSVKNKWNEIYDYNELAETYLVIKNNFRDGGRYVDMSWAYLKEKESVRLKYKYEIKKLDVIPNYYYLEFNKKILTKKEKFFIKVKYAFLYLGENLKFFLFGYGERPLFILAWSIFTIIIFSVLYFTNSALHSVYGINSGVSYLNNLYFSVVTFTTLGFGDFIPIGSLSKILTMVESLMGLFFYSLFVFSFGRRIAGR